MPKNVLIVARHFVPYFPSYGGIVRAAKMAEFFYRAGMDVHILAAKGLPVDYFGFEDLLNKFTMHYVDDPMQLVVTAQWLRRDPIPVHRQLPRTWRMLTATKRRNDRYVPDPGILLVLRHYRKAAEIIRRFDIKNVVVTTPAHSSQIVGLLLKLRFRDGIHLVADFRDSWNTTGIFRKKAAWSRWINRQMEIAVLRHADVFSCVSAVVLAKINRDILDVSSKSIVVENGFDPALRSDEPSPANDRLHIGHFGSLTAYPDSYRKPDVLIDIFGNVAAKFRLVCYGPTNLDMRPGKKRGILDLRKTVEPRQAIRLMRKMDILLVYHSMIEGADEVVTGKFYEYVLAERPIFALGPKDFLAARLVREHSLGYTADLYDRCEVTEVLERIFGDWENGLLPTYSSRELHQFSRDHQFSKLIGALQ